MLSNNNARQQLYRRGDGCLDFTGANDIKKLSAS
jgi:hypothetical protein